MATGRTPEERFLKMIGDLESRINNLEARPLQVPILDEDPSTDYKGNVWGFQDGRVHVRLPDGTIREVTSVASSGSTTGTPAPPVVAQPVTQSATWQATWSQAYRQSGGYTGGNNNYLYYGDSGQSSFNGRQSSLIGFDYAAIAAALSGAVINKVEIWFENLWTWSSGGGATIFFGMHNNTAKPATFGGVTNNFVSSARVFRNQSTWRTISTEFGSKLRDGTIRGVVFQAPNNSTAYYGYAAGVSAGLGIPALKITYTK